MKKNRLASGENFGFQVPPGYMENLEDRILSKLGSSEKGFSSKADNIFSLPENYFESFEDRLMAKLPPPSKKSRIISLLNREVFYYVAGVAAVFLAILVNTYNQQSEPFSLEHLDMLSLETYIDESFDHPTPEVSNLFSEELFSYAPTGQPANIDQEALIEYLHENIEEPSILFNED